MPQFPMTESRRPVLERIPDYQVVIKPADQHIVVESNGQILAESNNALLVQETRHQDVFYLPMADINLSLLTPTDHTTYCPFKGHASYWSLDETLVNFVWCYLSPYPEVEKIRSHLAFYEDKVKLIAT